MIKKFSIDNFRSINNRVYISFEASSAIKDLNNQGFSEIINNKLLNVFAMYGANSSGKSNILMAMGTMRSIVCRSVKLNENDFLPYDPFIFSNQPQRPTTFEIEFFIDTDFYQYGFSYNKQEIIAEWLNAKYQRRSQKQLFRREYQRIPILDNNAFAEGLEIKQALESEGGKIKLNANRLLISLAGQLGGTISNQIIRWFSSSLHVISGIKDYSNVTKSMIHNNPECKQKIISFLSNMDLGFDTLKSRSINIDDISFPPSLPKEMIEQFKKDQGNEIIEIQSVHNIYDDTGNVIGTKDCDFEETESAGTLKAFSLAGPIIDSIEQGAILCIDEIDAKLHPLITKGIYNYYNNKTSNANGAQLIVSTHDTSTMNFLRRDQIGIVKKTKSDSTYIETLKETDVKGISHKIRSDSNFEKTYLEGKIGGIPNIKND